jgi:hypothetical protein
MILTKRVIPWFQAAFVLGILLLLVQPATAQTVDPAIEDVYLAKDDGSGQAGEIVTEFRTTDVPIFCVVVLDTNEKVTVKMNFVAVSVGGVKADTKVVTASYTTSQGQNRVNFTGRPEGKWTPGRYRVDIFLDGKVVKNVEFDIKKTGGSGNGASAAKFVPPSTAKPAPAVPKKKN